MTPAEAPCDPRLRDRPRRRVPARRVGHARALVTTLLMVPAVAGPLSAAPRPMPDRPTIAVPEPAAPATSDGADELSESRFDALVEQLGDPDFAVREQATQALIDRPLLKTRIIDRLRRSPGPGEALSIEQRERLLLVLRDHVLFAPRGAIGIRMNAGLHPDGIPCVEVHLLIPGMPAEKVLRVGDRIIRIDDRRIESTQDLAEAVQTRLPGDEITIQVLRPRRAEDGALVVRPDRQTMYDDTSVRMRLAPYEDLPHDDEPGIRRIDVDRRRSEDYRRLHMFLAPGGIVVDLPGPVGEAPPSTARSSEMPFESHPLLLEMTARWKAMEARAEGATLDDGTLARWEAELLILDHLRADADRSAEEQQVIQQVSRQCRRLLDRMIELGR